MTKLFDLSIDDINLNGFLFRETCFSSCHERGTKKEFWRFQWGIEPQTFAFHWWNLFQTKNHVILEAEQLSSEDDDDDDDDEVDIPSDDDDDDDDLDSSSGSEEIPEAGEQVQQLTIQEEDGEELESEQEQDPDRIKMHE